ncbi:MAG: hypothetical protein KAQ68_11700 [Clostridiales bacterium]|nr:hypothetical protein [Clostridiales bacterium]
MAIAGLDVGQSGCKCTMFNDDGQVSTYAYQEYSAEKSTAGYFELNPQTVWESVCLVIKKAVASHKGSALKALCITSFGEVGVNVDKDGRILRNSISYTDFRGESQSVDFEKKLGRKEIVQRSGHVPHPMYPFSKLMWLRDNEPDIYNNTDVFLQYSDFILFMLSGEKYVDWSLASRTCMFNVIDKQFDDFLLDGARLDRSIFPEPVQPGLPVASMRKNVAESLGITSTVQLVLGGQDQICAALGAGVLKDSQAVNGIGTVDCITPLFNRPILNDAMADSGFSCIPYMLPNHYVTFAFNYSGGALLKWYKDKFSKAILHNLDKNKSAYSEMEKQAPKEPTDLLILPHLLGAATPYMDIDAVGAIIGLTNNTDAAQIYRGLLEGMAYEAKTNIDALKKAGVIIDRLTICGGGSRSPMALQIRADLFDMPVDVLEVEEAGTLGAAIMAGTACGLYKDIQDGVDHLVRIKKTFYPNDKNSAIYKAQYEKYQRVYPCIKQIQGN